MVDIKESPSSGANLSISEEVAMDLELARALALIADCLRTRYESTGFGGYNIYDDSRIHISRDTYASSLSVNVKNQVGEWSTVYSQRHRHLPQIRDGGRWRRYVMEILYPKAVEAYQATIITWQEEEKDKLRFSLAPIDDSDTFPDELFDTAAQDTPSEATVANPIEKMVIVPLW